MTKEDLIEQCILNCDPCFINGVLVNPVYFDGTEVTFFRLGVKYIYPLEGLTIEEF